MAPLPPSSPPPRPVPPVPPVAWLPPAPPFAPLPAVPPMPVPVGVPGELLVRPTQPTENPAVVYYGDAEATRAKNEGGWVHTGDLLRAAHRRIFFFAATAIVREVGLVVADDRVDAFGLQAAADDVGFDRIEVARDGAVHADAGQTRQA